MQSSAFSHARLMRESTDHVAEKGRPFQNKSNHPIGFPNRSTISTGQISQDAHGVTVSLAARFESPSKC